MITKQRRPIALFLVLAFVALLQVSAMPLRADRAPDRAVASAPDQAPGFVEEPGGAAPAAKKSIVPMVLIGVGVIALAAVLVLVVFKTTYNPVGSWSGPMSNQVPQNWTAHVVFSGDKKSGTVSYSDPWFTNMPGTYTVDKKDIVITITISGQTIKFTGAFETKDIMSGTWMNESNPGFKGPWELTRNAATAQMPAPQSAAGAKGIVRE